jgi:hypothetical protein
MGTEAVFEKQSYCMHECLEILANRFEKQHTDYIDYTQSFTSNRQEEIILRHS